MTENKPTLTRGKESTDSSGSSVRRRGVLVALGSVGIIGLAGCLDETEVNGDNGEGDVTVTDYWFEWDEREFGGDRIEAFIEVENHTDEDQSVNVEVELFEDDLLLDDVGPWFEIPPEATAQEDRTFLDLEPEDVDRVTNYEVRASGFAADPVTVSEGTGDEFRNDLGE